MFFGGKGRGREEKEEIKLGRVEEGGKQRLSIGQAFFSIIN